MRRSSRIFGTAAAISVALSGVAGLSGAPPASADEDPGNTQQVVTLVTGEQVLVRENDGRLSATSQAGEDFVTQEVGGDLYVIPAAALPYVGRSLDRSLFDVTALARDGIIDGDTPVEVSYVDKPVAVPGLDGGKVVDPKAFGAALKAHGPGALGLSSVRLDAPSTPKQVTPFFPMHTVKIHAIDADGAGATQQIGVINTDDSRKYAGIPVTVDGEARISVPDGNYALAADFISYGADGHFASIHSAISEFVVAGGDAEATIDARAATVPVTLTLPKPVATHEERVSLFRGDTTGTLGLSINAVFGNAALPVFVQPVAVAPHGSLHYTVGDHAEATADLAAPYIYDVKYDNDGTIGPDQRHVVKDSELTTVRERYYDDTPGRWESSVRLMFLPYEISLFGLYHWVKAPMARTEYVGGTAGLLSDENLIADGVGFHGITTGHYIRYRPATTVDYDWLRGPLAAGFTQPADSAHWICNACRTGDTLDLNVSRALDSLADSLNVEPGNTTHAKLTSGDTVLADQASPSLEIANLPPQRADYKLAFDYTRTGTWFHQSPSSHTEWTFGSAHSSSRAVPDNYFCGKVLAPPECSPTSLVTAQYQLDTALDGTITGCDAHAVLTFGHTQRALNVPVLKATAEVSFDGGTTWQRARLRPAGYNRFRASWDNPAAGGDVALRISGTDVTGASISQTVTAAYTAVAQS